MFLKDFAHCVWPVAPYIHSTKADARKKKKDCAMNGCTAYYGHGYVPLRFGGNIIREWEHNNKQKKKKEILAQKKKKIIKNQGFLSKKTQQKSLTTKKKVLSQLDYLQIVQSFYFGERNLYSCTWDFLSV